MLSLFPELLAYNLAVPLVFRLTVGMLFVSFGYANLGKNRESIIALLAQQNFTSPKVWLSSLAIVEIICGVFLIAGLYVQATALILSLILLLGVVAKHKNPENLKLSIEVLSLLFLITFSLLFLGAGLYAIDLPL